MRELKSAIRAIFQKSADWQNWPFPVSAALKNVSLKFFFFFIHIFILFLFSLSFGDSDPDPSSAVWYSVFTSNGIKSLLKKHFRVPFFHEISYKTNQGPLMKWTECSIK